MKTAPITVSAGGDNTLVAGVAGTRIRVFAYHLSFSGTVDVLFKDGASTPVSGLYYGTAGGNAPMPMGPMRGAGLQPLFETADGNALVLNLSGDVAVGGTVWYELLPV